jgi:endonuclease/exonuclease/phosphatase family metal-dependent hydrolase
MIRAMTWNTWWRFGGNWRQRESGTLDVVRRVDPDVLGIRSAGATRNATRRA